MRQEGDKRQEVEHRWRGGIKHDREKAEHRRSGRKQSSQASKTRGQRQRRVMVEQERREGGGR